VAVKTDPDGFTTFELEGEFDRFNERNNLVLALDW